MLSTTTNLKREDMPWNRELPLTVGTKVLRDVNGKTGTIKKLVRKKDGSITRIVILMDGMRIDLNFRSVAFMADFSIAPEKV
ncbi:MAG: hypothetical protein HOA57_01385 [Candidatus Magasanikbacteria bacterium]|jgi:hypothetical protein|nr:hypothetical protein [Candidatus Magasanikbacteria bacterium]MBT4315208.1 hypothetical protein [Candidatus Magasanikbacteria bacterium]MBT4547248.1 hypothetical protein [Candidatus Magasanikbacteria bacterium]MBT6819015.1 hypothetical protein [Candidatus Magasanikbacteria bacterium]